MRIDEKRLQQMALTYPADTATLAAGQMARELLAARQVVEAARAGDAERLEDVLAAYAETAR